MKSVLNHIAGLLLVLVLTNCSTQQQQSEIVLADLQPVQMQCLFFFIPDCPACKASIPALMELHKKYAPLGLDITAILSDPAPNDSVLQATIDYYELTVPLQNDSNLAIARKYHASTTPQFMLFDANEKLVYNGKINNYYYQFGKHRKVVTENYLEDAILALLEKREVVVKSTDPIGCKINLDDETTL